MKCQLVSLLLLSFGLLVFPIEVEEEELKSTEAVEFINFEGHQPESSADVIRGIGRTLSREIEKSQQRGWYANKYSAIHAYDVSEPARLGADIVTIEQSALVNHINSLRLIPTGFLEAQYGYSREDAEVLSVFVTHYNAVYRGNAAYFAELYQGLVVAKIDENSAGISRNYKDWPGSSQILIPLTDKAKRDDIRALDTSVLSDEKVVQELQQTEDKGTEERKELTEIKQKEVAKTEEELKTDKEQITATRDEIVQKEEALAREKADTKAEEQQLAEAKEEVKTLTDEKAIREKNAALDQQERDIAQAKAEQEKKQAEIDKQKQAVAEQQAAVEQVENKVEEKKAEIEEDKQAVAKDEKIKQIAEEIKQDPEKAAEEIVKKEEELKEIARRDPITRGFLYYLKVNEYLTDGHYANDLYRIDALTGEYLSKAPEKPHIAGHKYDIVPDLGVLVLSQGEAREAHYLTLLDLVTLEPLQTSNVDVFHRSFIERRGGFIYTLNYKEEGDFRLGKYDAASLDLLAESEELVDKNTVFHMSGNLIFVNSKQKNMLVLDAGDLSLTNTIDLP